MSEPTTPTLGSWFAYTRNQLDEADAQILCETAFEVSYSDLIASTNNQLSHAQVDRLREFIRRRQSGEPVAYIIGSRGFWRHEFTVSSDTLIPRPETETLVETVLPFLSESTRVLDLGTGSGAIGLSIAAATGAHVLMTDVSCGALQVAENNAMKLNLKVRISRSNWYDAINERFDCIVSNPPYVPSGDKHLKHGDLRSEPRIALDGGSDGLDTLRLVVGGAHAHLTPGGRLAVEHGFDQSDAVHELFKSAGFRGITLVRDCSDNPRVTHGVIV